MDDHVTFADRERECGKCSWSNAFELSEFGKVCEGVCASDLGADVVCLAVPGPLALKLQEAKRISILAARPGVPLPLELAYSRELDDDAVWCPRGADAVRKGSCPGTCDSAHQGKFVCPLGFWAFSKVIERHENPAASHLLQEGGFTLHPDSTVGADVLHLAGVLAAGADRADDNESVAWRTAQRHLKDDLGNKVAFAADWTEWERKERRKKPPGLLLLIAHVEDAGGLRQLELGKGSLKRRFRDAIPQQLDGPLVLLLGCETGSGTQPIQDFTTMFLNAGAKVVISTFTIVRGRWAAPLGVALVQALRDVARQEHRAGGVRVGEALLRVRRACLADNPMVLSLIACGDADYWIEP